MNTCHSLPSGRKAVFCLVTAVSLALLSAGSASAASGTWNGGSAANGNWSTTGNWSATPVPGATSGTTSADVATFNAAIANTWGNAAGNPIVIDSGRNILSISFATSPGNYFVGSTGGNALLLSSGGSIANGVVSAVETINCPIVLEPASSTTAGSYIFTSTATTGTGYLNFGGNISGGTTTAGIVLNWNGQNANANTISGVISDGGAAGGVSLFKSSAAAGTLYLTGANTYSGTTTINRGTINVGVAENPGVSGPLGKSTAAGSIILPGSASAGGTGVLQYSAANQYDYSSRFSTATNQYYSVDTAGQTVTWASALTSTNATTLTKSGGAGTLILLGTNTYDGLTTIGGASGSILVISNSSALGSTAAGTVISQGAALRLEGNIAVGPESLSVAGTGFGSGSLYNLSGNNSYGGVITLTGSAGVLFVSASGSLTLTNTAIITSASAQTMSLAGNGTLTMNGGIGTGITVTRTTGTGTTILAGTNLYTAATTISANAGTLQFATPYALYSNTPASWTAANLIVNSGSTLAVNIGGPNDFTTTQVGTLLGNLTTSINNNGLEAGANFGLDTTYATAPVTYSSAIGNSTGTGSGSLGIVKLGAGTLTLNGANTYSGTTTINAGTLSLASANISAGGTSLNGGVLNLANVSAIGPTGNTLNINAAATNQLSTDTAFGGANPVYNVTMGNNGSYVGTMILNRATAGATSGIAHNFGQLTISLSGNGTGGLNVLAGANAPTGGAADTLAFSGLSFGNWYNVTETIAPFGANVVLGGTVAPVTPNPQNSTMTLALDGTSAGNQITGNISDTSNGAYNNAAAILKSNSSTWSLSGANIYTGNTTISAGTLALSGSGSLTSPNIIIGGGAKFDVSGLSSTFTLGSGQTLSNSTSTAVLKGNASTGSGTVSLAYSNGTPSMTVTNGTLTLSSGTTFNVNIIGAPLANGTYKLISASVGGAVAVADSLPTATVSGTGFVGSGSLVISNAELYLEDITYEPGFVVNGVFPPQTDSIVGPNSSGDMVYANGTFAGAFSKNSGNIYNPERFLIYSTAVITNPGDQPVQFTTSTFTGSDNNTYNNNTYNQALFAFGAGSLTNEGAINYVSTDPSGSGSSSDYLYDFDSQIFGNAPGLGNQDRNYYWGDGIYANVANVQYDGGAIFVVNGAANNTNATISADVNGSYQDFVAGINAAGYYNNIGTNADITVANYGTISGTYNGSYNGAAAGLYGYTLYGGQNVSNFSSGSITASAPYYTTAIYASTYYGNVNVVDNGVVAATATGAQQGNTAGLGAAVGIDLFDYNNGSVVGTGNINLLTSGPITATAAATNSIAYAVFCWAQGGSLTYTNTGALTATATTSGGSAQAKSFYGGCTGPVTLFNSGTVTGTAPNGGWAYGTENDSGNPISIVNSGSLYHNTGLGLFIYGAGGGVATVTNSGSIYGGNEGIAAENYTGQLTIYDSGPVLAGNANNNAMDLGSSNDIVHLYGLPNIVGWMNGQGGSNLLDFHLVGTLQKVNGTNATQSTNLAAYNFNPTTTNSIIVSGQTYKWVNFYVTGFVVSSVNTTPTNITSSVSGSTLNLSWPADHTGWRLLAQTNHLSKGVSGNTNDWATYAGGYTTTNAASIPIVKTNSNEYYRLVYP